MEGNSNVDTKEIPRNKDDWSNLKCAEIAFKENFPASVKDTGVQKTIIERFINFYLGAKPPKGLLVTDLIYSIIAIMPLHTRVETLVWKKEHFKNNGKLFFLSPEDRLKAELGTGGENIVEDNDSLDKEELNKTESEGISSKYSQQVECSECEDVIEEFENQAQSSSSNRDPEPSFSENHTKYGEINEEKSTNEGKGSVENDKIIVDKLSNNDKVWPTLPADIIWFGNKQRQNVGDKPRVKYGPVENSAFIKSCNGLLEKWDTVERARIILKYFFAIIALTMLRATTKTYMHLMYTFTSTKFLETIDFKTGPLKYSAPHKKCVKACYRTFNKRDGNISVMFAKIILNSFYLDKLRKDQENKDLYPLNIFKFTVLSHTADYGLGLLSMLQTIHSRNSIHQLESIVEATYCNDTAETWGKLKRFMDKYMSPSTNECTHHWARLIDGDYFRDLCCSNNVALGIVLAVFLDKITDNPGIWGSIWMRNIEHVDKYKELGLKMYNDYLQIENRELRKMLGAIRKTGREKKLAHNDLQTKEGTLEKESGVPEEDKTPNDKYLADSTDDILSDKEFQLWQNSLRKLHNRLKDDTEMADN